MPRITQHVSSQDELTLHLLPPHKGVMNSPAPKSAIHIFEPAYLCLLQDEPRKNSPRSCPFSSRAEQGSSKELVMKQITSEGSHTSNHQEIITVTVNYAGGRRLCPQAAQMSSAWRSDRVLCQGGPDRPCTLQCTPPGPVLDGQIDRSQVAREPRLNGRKGGSQGDLTTTHPPLQFKAQPRLDKALENCTQGTLCFSSSLPLTLGI